MKQERKPNRKNTVWIVSALILSVGLVIAVGVLLYTKLYVIPRKDTSLKTTETESLSELSESTTHPDAVSVSFYDDKNELVETKSVKFGQAVFPPNLANSVSGRIFLGWSHNLSCMTKDTQLYPVYNHYDKRSNVLSFDTVYVDSKDDFTVDLNLGGIVQLASFDMIIPYDDNTIHLKSVSETVPGLKVKDENNRIVIHFDSKANITEPITLAKLSFDVENVDFLKTELSIDIKNGSAYIGGDLKYIDCTLVKGIVYIY